MGWRLACLLGVVGLAAAFTRWHGTGFGHLDYESSLRVVMPSVTALIASCQMILGMFFLAVLGIRHAPEPTLPDQPNGARAPAQAAQPGTWQPEQTKLTIKHDFSRGQNDMWER